MSWLVDGVLAPLVQYEFLRTALGVAVLVGASSAALSCFLVVRRAAMLGDAVAHGVLPGVAVGWVLAGHLGVFWGAVVVGIVVAVGISALERTSRLHLDTAIGVMFSFSFALGLLLVSVLRPTGIHLNHVLLGNVLAASDADLQLAAATSVIVLIGVLALFPILRAWSFAPETATVMGLPTRALHYAFTALLSLAIVASLQTVGLVLAVGMLILPGAAAYLCTNRMSQMIAIAMVIGVGSAAVGMLMSYHLNAASGPAIVLAASAAFLLCYLFAPQRGVLARRRHARGSGSRVRTRAPDPIEREHAGV